MTTAREILEHHPRDTWAERLDVARRIVRETGDLPAGIWRELWLGQTEVDMTEAAAQLSALSARRSPLRAVAVEHLLTSVVRT